MAGRFHVNDKGVPGRCDAKIRCRFNLSEEEHYSTEAEARAAFERGMKDEEMPAGVSKGFSISGFKRRFALVGGALALTASLTACNSGGNSITADSSKDDRSVTQKILDEGSGIVDDAASKAGEAVSKKANEALKNGAKTAADEAGKLVKGAINGVSVPDAPNKTGVKNAIFMGESLQKSPAEVAEARRTLDSLKVAPEITSDPDVAHYNRGKLFGKGFEAGVVGRLEHRDIPNATFANDSPQARAIGGTFIDPYSMQSIQVSTHVKDDTDIEHVVALKEALKSGAASWDEQFGQEKAEELRKAYANDPMVTLVAGSSANRIKGDKDASQYLPSSTGAPQSDCAYVIQQIKVKGKYALAVNTAEKAAMIKVLSTKCSPE